ncbi:MAG: PmoA family protein, partial [Verrucomicrobiae bacterium]|nr:PmoA family protein [Verrucomicrobiae bacterium]
ICTALHFQDKPGQQLDVLRNQKLLARYLYANDPARPTETDKPFLHVFDPDGQFPITNGPGGEYPHHRGIFIGWRKLTVNGKPHDFWSMKDGQQIHRKLLITKDGSAFTSLVDWLTNDSTLLLKEQRTFRFLEPPAPAYALIETRSKLKAVAGEPVLDGDPEHAGLQFRPANDIDRTATAYFFPKENADPRTDKDYPWVGVTFSLHGKPFSVVYLNHPSNPKDAVTSAYRDYGRFGMFAKATIPNDSEKTICVRFLIVAGEMPSADSIQKAYKDFAGVNLPTPNITIKKAETRPSPKPKTKKK